MNRLCTFLALAGVLVVAACDDQPTSPRETKGPSAAIYDADHDGDNKEVFFLPPIVPNPSGSEFFKPGEFNPNLTSAVIRVCHMVNNACETVVASFGAGQATGPIVISLADEHYLAVWHTDQSNLVAGDAYRIEVFVDGDVNGDPVAWADVAVGSTMKELKNLNTNETIALVDGRTLPIKVRFQNGVRCESANCLSQRVTTEGGNLILESGNGALVLQEGWLPSGVSEVTVTLQRHPTGSDNDCVGNAAYTGPGLVAQREACLEVTTDPVLLPGATTGIQRPAFIFVCTEASATDPLFDFLQIIKADDGRPLQPLKDVSDDELIALGFNPTCEGTPSEIGLSSHPLMRLASRGLNAVARLLEVKPLYAIDLGQGGEISLFDGFSHFTLGVMGSAAAFGTTPETATAGSTVPLSVRITGLTVHPPSETLSDGLAGVAVTFAITDGSGGLSDPADEGELDPVTSITVQTNADGVATANLTVAEGANVVEAVGMVGGSPVTLPVTFSVTGTAATIFAGSVVVFKDLDAFNNNWVGNANNTRLVQNLVGFTGTEPRATGNRVVFDHGKGSLCGADPFTACAGFSSLKAIISNQDYLITDVASSATSTPLATLGADVKVVFLVAPQDAYTATEINGLKAFAAGGGRIVYLADYCTEGGAYCGGISTQNALMSALGAAITHVNGAFGAPGDVLPVSVAAHQVTAGVVGWQTAGAGALNIGAGATALLVYGDEGGQHVLAAIAPVDVTPIVLLQ